MFRYTKLTFVLQLPTIPTVACCPGVQPRGNRLDRAAQVCGRLHHRGLCEGLRRVRTTTKSPNDAFLRIYPLIKQHVAENDSHLPYEETEAQRGEMTCPRDLS